MDKGESMRVRRWLTGWLAGWLVVPALAGLSLLPALPVLGCVAVIARYLVEEEDEYLRLRAAQASLIGTGLLLVAAILWGFLQQAGLAGAIASSAVKLRTVTPFSSSRFWMKCCSMVLRVQVEASDARPMPSARRMFRKASSARSAKLTSSSG